MDSSSSNHYEEQLYSVFKAFDVDNEEAINKSAVLDLCDALQLEDRGVALVDTLFERQADKVTFTQFRNGLLTILGGGSVLASGTEPAKQVSSLMTASQTVQSDDDSSGCEVAPKFVFGSKKYGRRSRPQYHHSASQGSPSPRAASESRLEVNNKRIRQKLKCRRSVSLMENRNESLKLNTEGLDHDKLIHCDEALALCHTLNMDGIDQHVVKNIFDDSMTKETTVGDFFDRLNASLASSIAAACNSSTVSTHSDLENDIKYSLKCSIASDNIIEAWERFGVDRPQQLLGELGFSGPSIHSPDLEHALEDEVRGMTTPTGDPTTMLLLAAFAFSRLQTQHANQYAEVTVAERDKLRSDLAEANRRAQILAQDVDDNHARIEVELKSRIKQVEARHAETFRRVVAEHTDERERAITIRAQLEAELAAHTDSAAHLHTELTSLRDRCEEFEKRANSADARVHELEQERDQLAIKLTEIEGQHKEVADAEVVTAELTAKINKLQLENKKLRDHNDELCSELEGEQRPIMQRVEPVAVDASATTWCEEVAAAACCHEHDPFVELQEECDSSPASIEQKVLGYAEVVRRLQGALEVLRAAPAPLAGTECGPCSALRGLVAAVHDILVELSEAVILPERIRSSVDAIAQTERVDCYDPAGSRQTESELRAELLACRRDISDAEQRHEQEKNKLSNLIRELEWSLEQLKEEYDKCEEYWSGKVEEERRLCAEEVRAGDERLAALAENIREYERQFRAALPTVPESRDLEAQVEHLQQELETSRREAARQVELHVAELARRDERGDERRDERRDERPDKRRDYHNPAFTLPPSASALAPTPALAQLNKYVSVGVGVTEGELEEGCGGRGGARGAGMLRARLSAAERALHALHARLLAADLLVKDLYIENCHLHHAHAHA